MSYVLRRSLSRKFAFFTLIGMGAGLLSCSTTPAPSSDQVHQQEADALLKTGTVEELYKRANASFDAQDYLTAFRFYRAIIDRDPNHLGALVNLGVCARRLGDVDGAIGWYDRALTVAPNDPTALQDRIVAGLLLGRAEECIPLAVRLTKLSPEEEEVWKQLGNLYMQTGQFKEAASAFQKAVSLNGDDPRNRYQLGVALAATDNYADASKNFAKALELNPDLREAYPLQVQMLIYLDRYDEAWATVAEGQTRDAIFDPDLILDLQRLSGQVGPR